MVEHDDEEFFSHSGVPGDLESPGNLGPSPTRPLFLRASDPETWEKPADTSWGDHSLHPDRPLTARHRRLAQLLARGATNQEITVELGYTEAWISRLKSNSKIIDEVDRCLDRLYEEDLEKRMKHLGSDGMDVIEEILRDPGTPAVKKESAAKWLLEKLTGKPAQQVDIKGEVHIGMFLEQLDKMKERGQMKTVEGPRGHGGLPSSPSSPSSEPEVDPLEQWISEHV